MRPVFGRLTRVLAVVFALAGLGAAYPAIGDSDASNRIILAAIAIAFLGIGAGLWMEFPWAWWAGFAVTAFTVVMSLVLKAPDGGGLIWPALLLVWMASAVVSWRRRAES